MKQVDEFASQKQQAIESMAKDAQLQSLTRQWFIESCKHQYSYLFTWLGRPIIQYPQDMIAMQEIIWNVRPELIIETGIAHGGSLIFYASILELIGGNGKILGIDLDIREHNKIEIERHPLAKRITMIQGSSTDEEIMKQVLSFTKGKKPVLVVLDSNHTHAHVLKELECYSPLVTNGSYLVVFDTVVEDMPAGSFPNRPWDKGNNPKTAAREFLKKDNRFVVDKEIEAKLLITVAPEGYLRCVRD
jgi:cephalosporin hydroxylase